MGIEFDSCERPGQDTRREGLFSRVGSVGACKVVGIDL